MALLKRIIFGAFMIMLGMAMESLVLTKPACDKFGYFYNVLSEKYVCYPDMSEILK